MEDHIPVLGNIDKMVKFQQDVSLVISLAMCVIQSRVGVSVPPLPPDHSVVSASPTPGVMIE